jgi:hypothetical protein
MPVCMNVMESSGWVVNVGKLGNDWVRVNKREVAETGWKFI